MENTETKPLQDFILIALMSFVALASCYEIQKLFTKSRQITSISFAEPEDLEKNWLELKALKIKMNEELKAEEVKTEAAKAVPVVLEKPKPIPVKKVALKKTVLTHKKKLARVPAKALAKKQVASDPFSILSYEFEIFQGAKKVVSGIHERPSCLKKYLSRGEYICKIKSATGTQILKEYSFEVR